MGSFFEPIVCSGFPVVASQSFTTPSKLDVAINLLSWLNSTPKTVSECGPRSAKWQHNLFSRREWIAKGGGFHRAEKLISFTPFSFNFATTSGSVSSRSSFARDARRRVLTPSSSASSYPGWHISSLAPAGNRSISSISQGFVQNPVRATPKKKSGVFTSDFFSLASLTRHSCDIPNAPALCVMSLNDSESRSKRQRSRGARTELIP